jgi:DnaJ-class molecular chaperone
MTPSRQQLKKLWLRIENEHHSAAESNKLRTAYNEIAEDLDCTPYALIDECKTCKGTGSINRKRVDGPDSDEVYECEDCNGDGAAI